MARLVPDRPADTTQSNAELKVFDLIKQRLGDDWIALHSLGLAFHARKPWAEIDFVLIGPPGVFCIEVKGGRVARANGLWQFKDRFGATSVKTQGPFEQVGGAVAALRGFLLSTHPQLRHVPMGYGVVMPDISFHDAGPDILTEVLCDERRIANWPAYIRDLAAYWQDRVGSKQELDGIQRMEVLDTFRGDFDQKPSLKTLVGSIGAELLSLTQEQYKVLDALSDNDHVIVAGGAGTGKTLLALQEAERLSRNDKKVFLCCFNRNLGTHLTRATAEMPGIVAGHLHAFMADVITRAGLAGDIATVDAQDRYLVEYPRLALEGLLALDELEQFDALVIDEGQDILLPPYLEVLDSILKEGLRSGKWQIFLDPRQDLFGGISRQGMDAILAMTPARYRLSTNCRNTAPIAVSTALLSGVPSEATLKSTGPDVETHFYSNRDEARRLVSKSVARLFSEHLNPAQIVILSPYRLENSSMAAGFTGIPYVLEAWDGPDERAKTIRFSTTSGFKGLEADAVLLIDVDDLGSPEGRMAIYVGASRARVLLQVFVKDDQEMALAERAFEFGQATVPN